MTHIRKNKQTKIYPSVVSFLHAVDSSGEHVKLVYDAATMISASAGKRCAQSSIMVCKFLLIAT